MFLNGNVIFNDFGRCFLGLFSVCFWSSGSIVRNSFFSFRLRSFLACLIAKMFFIKLWRFWRFRDGGFGILRLMIMIIIPLLVACKTWRRRWINFILGGTFRLNSTLLTRRSRLSASWLTVTFLFWGARIIILWTCSTLTGDVLFIILHLFAFLIACWLF